MKLLFLLIFFFTQIQTFAGDKSVINFSADKTKVNKKIEVEFENATNLFTLKVESQIVRTFHEMKVDELIDLLNDDYIKEEFHEETQKVLKTVQLLDAVSDPSDERLITASLLMLEDSIDTINNPPGGMVIVKSMNTLKTVGLGFLSILIQVKRTYQTLFLIK